MQRRTAFAAGIFMAALLLGTPVVSAFSVGVDADYTHELKAAGGNAKYAQIWVGKWTAGNWGSYESDLRAARDQGAIPVVLWYYWGDGISPDAVKYGKDGKSRSQWDSMAKELAVRGQKVMGGKTFIVVLEPEFNKNGISSWEDFDGYLANQANLVKWNAGGAKVAVGFGYWGGWDKFDRAVSASHYTGFQLMRASTRDSTSQGTGMADQAVDVAQKLKARWGKPVILFDLAVASYGGWEWVQEKAIQGFDKRRSDLDNAGVFGVVYRYTRDNCLSSGYFGPAECHWGLKTSSGSPKAAWNDWVAISKGGSTSLPTSGSTSTSTSTSGSFDATFSSVKVDEWWTQVSVGGNKGIAKVHARVDGGTWVELPKQSWGAYAKSIHVKSGSTVEFRATATDGTTDLSGKYARGGTLTSGSTSTSTSSSTSSSVSWGTPKVDAWWVQASPKSSMDIVKVHARVNGGSWQTLDDKGWGYAKSIQVPSTAYVEFLATTSDGKSYMSGKYARGGGSYGGSTSTSGSFDAKFSSVKVSEWWVQSDVSGSKSISKVHARVNGGTWTELPKQSWGAYAKSVHVKSGQYVEFRATATDGSTDVSGKYWR